MKKAHLQQFIRRFDELPVAGMDTIEVGPTVLNVAHVGNLVTVQMQPPVDSKMVEWLDAAIEREYFVDSKNLAVGYWAVLAEGAELPE